MILFVLMIFSLSGIRIRVAIVLLELSGLVWFSRWSIGCLLVGLVGLVGLFGSLAC
jgi:hypothetical protein